MNDLQNDMEASNALKSILERCNSALLNDKAAPVLLALESRLKANEKFKRRFINRRFVNNRGWLVVCKIGNKDKVCRFPTSKYFMKINYSYCFNEAFLLSKEEAIKLYSHEVLFNRGGVYRIIPIRELFIKGLSEPGGAHKNYCVVRQKLASYKNVLAMGAGA